jgi:5-formyltetrahydrofolate cyclo-ligase
LHQLKKNNWGILEPSQGIPTPPEKIDLVLVPLLAFDKQGNRVGYGKGYYDRFLSTCSPETKKVGISLFSSEEEIHTTDTDVQLDQCITPIELLTFY